MKIMLWMLGIIGIFIVALAALVLLQYSRMRKLHPKPEYKRPNHTPTPREWSDEQVTVSWIGHTAAAFAVEDVSKPDLILLSHAHLDHFDLPSLKRLQRRTAPCADSLGHVCPVP